MSSHDLSAQNRNIVDLDDEDAGYAAGEGEATGIGPDGLPVTVDNLPPPNTKRWVMRRKAEVVAGVRSGVISLDEACQRYTLSVEEFLSWQRLIDSHGVRGLRATRLQDYRGGVAPMTRHRIISPNADAE